MLMLEQHLEKLGLNKTEVKIYLALLPLGTAPASVLGNRVGMPRSTAKYTCQQLVEKGLVTATNKNNTFLYSAKNPESLHTLLEKEKKSLVQKENELNSAIQNLKNLFHPQAVLPKVKYFEGAESVAKMLEDVLKEQKPLYGALHLDEDIHPIISSYFRDVYIPERKRLKFPSWMLFGDNEITRAYRRDDLKMNRISLLVPQKQFPFEICFHIYGDKIAFYSYKSNDLAGVIIQDTYIKNLQFSLFKLAWNFARLLEVNKNYRKVEINS